MLGHTGPIAMSIPTNPAGEKCSQVTGYLFVAKDLSPTSEPIRFYYTVKLLSFSIGPKKVYTYFGVWLNELSKNK